MIELFKKSIFILTILFCSFAQASEKENSNGINKQIDSLAYMFSDGIAVTYPEFRYVKYGNIFGAKNDAVVFFSIEGFFGGNIHIEYIAFFSEVEKINNEKKKKEYRLVSVKQIGARGWRTFEPRSAEIINKTIVVPVTGYKDSDPMCCPSLEGKAIFTPAIQGEIVEKI